MAEGKQTDRGGGPPASEPDETAIVSSDAGLPTRIGPYHLRRVIAAGGMGTVFEAMQQNPRRRVALKLMKQGISSRTAMRRFEYESQILARLRHPCIAQVYEAGTHDDGSGGVPYFAMEYIPNARPITDYAGSKKLGTRQRLELFASVCDAVHHGHQKGIIHRDLKPANILVDSNGQPKVIDFGVARATDSDLAVTTLQTDVGQLIGTLQYMSPEQCDADPADLDTRSDVYALGVVLYELLCGQLPYDVTKVAVFDVSKIICEEVPPKPSSFNRTLRGDAETITLKALEKDRRRRYQSADELGRDIRHYLHDEPIEARPPSLLYLSRKLLAKHTGRALTLLGLAIAPFLLMGIIGTSWQWRRADEQKVVAEAQRDLAERRFEEVRELARLIIFDLHDAIQSLSGGLPARELLVRVGEEYLEGLATTAGNDSTLLRELASGYDRIGDIRGGTRNPSLGDTEGAMTNYRKAFEIRSSLVRDSPGDRELMGELAASHTRIGDALRNMGQAEDSLASFREALEIHEQLAAVDPDARRRLGISLNNVGSALSRMGQLAEAKSLYERSLAVREELLAEQPDSLVLQRDLSVALGRVGSLAEETGSIEEALSVYMSMVDIRQRIVRAQPESSRARRDLAVARFFAGHALLELDRPDEALLHLLDFLALAEEQVANAPSSSRARRDLAAANEAVGMAFEMMGDWTRAQEHYDRFVSIIGPLLVSDPDNSGFRSLRADSHERLGDLYTAKDMLDQAVVEYRDALAIVSVLAAADAKDYRGSVDHARLLYKLGRALGEVGEAGEARQTLDSATAIFEKLVAQQPEAAKARKGLMETIEALRRLDSSD